MTNGAPSSLRVLPTGQTMGALPVDHLDGRDQLAMSVETTGGSPQPADLLAVMALT
ncbi:hypothetical protein [Cryptosporangium sp. NPDC048952]|uniref:hypothetical protein n=1 Tax=Cryptosporangium sp. NPDC048952 TaxID=3363961 RepID=UPI003716EE55